LQFIDNNFTYDYAAMRAHMRETIFEELMQNRFHPRNMNKWLGWGQVDATDFE
jgi:hypothetical protein